MSSQPPPEGGILLRGSCGYSLIPKKLSCQWGIPSVRWSAASRAGIPPRASKNPDFIALPPAQSSRLPVNRLPTLPRDPSWGGCPHLRQQLPSQSKPAGHWSVSEVAPASNPCSATCCRRSVAKSCLTLCDPTDCNAKDWFHGRPFLHSLGWVGGWFQGWFKHITCIVHFISNLMPPLTWPEVPVLSPEGGDPDLPHRVVERTVR